MRRQRSILRLSLHTLHVLAVEVATCTQAEETQNKSAVELTLHVLADEVATQVGETQGKSAVELELKVVQCCRGNYQAR